jgi:hypothetical protein
MHLVVPLIGFLIIGYIEYSADTPAKIGGGIWLGIGVIVLLIRIATGRSTEINLDESKPA